jgi:cell wall-associated NlpC family hydrolase
MKSIKLHKSVLFVISCTIFLLGTVNTASAAQKNYSNKSKISAAQMQQAYAQLIKKPIRKKVKVAAKLKKKANPARFRAIAVAKKQIRKKYRWGGSTPKSGFDCSGLTHYAFKSANIHIPRTTAAQYKHSKRISLSKMQAGDLIFFHTRRTRARVNHVGIYLGNGKFIHAPRRGKRVSVAKLSKYWRRKAVGAGRV